MTAERGEDPTLQKFTGLVQRAELQPRLRERFGRAFFAVDHGEHQRDHAAGVAHGFRRLQRRAAGRGDVLDDHDALAFQGLALGQPLDRQPRAVLLWLLAHEERRDRVALDPGELRDRAGQRHRAHFQPADEVEIVVLQRLIGQFGQQRRAFGIEHGRLEVEIEIALAARGQRDFAAAERSLADDLGEAGAGG